MEMPKEFDHSGPNPGFDLCRDGGMRIELNPNFLNAEEGSNRCSFESHRPQPGYGAISVPVIHSPLFGKQEKRLDEVPRLTVQEWREENGCLMRALVSVCGHAAQPSERDWVNFTADFPKTARDLKETGGSILVDSNRLFLRTVANDLISNGGVLGQELSRFSIEDAKVRPAEVAKLSQEGVKVVFFIKCRGGGYHFTHTVQGDQGKFISLSDKCEIFDFEDLPYPALLFRPNL